MFNWCDIALVSGGRVMLQSANIKVSSYKSVDVRELNVHGRNEK